jgi:tripartite-type tricarboxylate transporter receptor subunit TctC
MVVKPYRIGVNVGRKMFGKRTNILGAFSAVGVALSMVSLSEPATAQSAADYPNRTIRIVVGFTPGGAPDITARVIAQGLQERWKQSVVVENRPGAGSAIAAQFVANSAPDGYTLMSITNAHAVAPAINPKLTYDALEAFAPVTMTSSAPKWVLVPPSLGVKTLKDLVALAKQKPNALNYSSSGGGSFMHFSAAIFNDAVGIEAQHIPLKGPPEALTEVVAGRVQYAISPIGASSGLVRDGQLLALAVMAEKRLPDFPNVPTVAEAGFPGIEQTTWTAILAPAKTPPAIVAKLNEAIGQLLHQPDTRKKWASFGIDPVPTTPEQLRKILAQEIDDFTKAARRANISIQ